MKEYKIKFMSFSKVIKANGYKVACKEALQFFFKKHGYPKKLPVLIQIQRKTKFGWDVSYWDMREALKLLKTKPKISNPQKRRIRCQKSVLNAT